MPTHTEGGYLIRLGPVVYEPKGGGSFTLGDAWRELVGVACCAIIRDLDGVTVMRRGYGSTELLRRDGVFRDRWSNESRRQALGRYHPWFRNAEPSPLPALRAA